MRSGDSAAVPRCAERRPVRILRATRSEPDDRPVSPNPRERGKESLLTHKEMFNTGQANRADVLLAQVAVNDAKIELRGMENRYTAHWQQLTARWLAGFVSYASRRKIEPEGAPPSGSSLERLLRESPELQAARVHVVHDQISVQAARKQSRYPIFNSRVSPGITETRNATAGVQVGFKIPVWDRTRAPSIKFRQTRRSQAEVRRIEVVTAPASG